MTKKTAKKTNLLVELTKQKMDAQKAGASKSEPFGKFKKAKPRNENNSSVGPSWGGRKGN